MDGYVFCGCAFLPFADPERLGDVHRSHDASVRTRPSTRGRRSVSDRPQLIWRLPDFGLRASKTFGHCERVAVLARLIPRSLLDSGSGIRAARESIPC